MCSAVANDKTRLDSLFYVRKKKLFTWAMYARYKNMSLSVSFSGDDGFIEETQADVKYFT